MKKYGHTCTSRLWTINLLIKLMLNSKCMPLQAERMFQVALRGDPAHAPTLKAYSRLLDESFRDLKGALEVSRRAFDADPSDSSVSWRLGRLLMDEAKDYEGAEMMLRRALDLDLDCAEALYDYGRLLEEIHQNHDSAERMFRRCMPYYLPLLSNRRRFNVILIISACLYDAALDDCRALRVDPQHVPSLSSLGLLILEHRGNVEEAESLYKRALSIDANDLGTLFNYGILLQVQDFD